MTADLIARLAGIVISLVFSFTPKLTEWYYSKSDDAKRIIMLLTLLVVTLAVFGLSCAKIDLGEQYQIACTKQGAVEMAKLFIYAAISNQVTYKLTPKKLTLK